MGLYDRDLHAWTQQQLAKHLDENPSLRAAQQAVFDDAFGTARQQASGETDLPPEVFPVEPPFTFAQALDPDWRPGGPAPQSSSTASNGA